MRGISVTLYNKIPTDEVDEFGRPMYEEVPETVENVLVGEPAGSDVPTDDNLTGKHVAYTLAIPKGDNHVWTDRRVSFFGEMFKVIGTPTQGIDHLIPLAWNKKVRVERYE